MRMMRRLRHFGRSERAAVTAEFVIAFPLVFTMLLIMLELTFLMVRSTMLQHGLDLVLREVRLGNMVNPNAAILEEAICDKMTIFSDCEKSLTLEFATVDLTTFAMPGQQTGCAPRSHDEALARAGMIYQTGTANQLVVVRACVMTGTITPVLTDSFRLFARSAFVNEPRE